MRKIAATYVFTGQQPPIKNGILVCTNDGIIIKIIDNKGELKEEAGLEYYSGILVPGFVPALFEAEINSLTERKLWVAGIAAAGTPKDTIPNYSTKNKVYFQGVKDEGFFRGLEKMYSVLPIESIHKNPEIVPEIIENNNTSNFCVALKESTSILPHLTELQLKKPQLTLFEILTWATLNGAKALGIETEFGSFEPGKKPGINLISAINYSKFSFTQNSRVKRLA